MPVLFINTKIMSLFDVLIQHLVKKTFGHKVSLLIDKININNEPRLRVILKSKLHTRFISLDALKSKTVTS
jgi:hypothetical protein